jgi:hypothetical protein
MRRQPQTESLSAQAAIFSSCALLLEGDDFFIRLPQLIKVFAHGVNKTAFAVNYYVAVTIGHL